ncbi:MAG: hypothetical protein ACXIUB_05305 [Wenzhouxiangella sp.]
MRFSIMIAVLALLLSACGSVNQPIQIDAHSTIDRDLSSVNGAIQIGEGSRISGDVSNVNGSIRIGNNVELGAIKSVNGAVQLGTGVRARSVATTNGALEIGANSAIGGNVSTVNGRLRLADAVEVDGSASTRNGMLSIAAGSRVNGKVSTGNGALRVAGSEVGEVEIGAGRLELLDGTRVRGNVTVLPSRRASTGRPPTVEIGANTVVEGSLIIERPVRLRIHESAAVGEIHGAEPEFFGNEHTDEQAEEASTVEA